MSIRSLLARVQRLEEAQVSPWDALVGPTEDFATFIADGIAVGNLDKTDAPMMLACVRTWIRESS